MNVKKFVLIIPMIMFFTYSDCQSNIKLSKGKSLGIEFEVFSEIPNEIDGCICLFSKSEADYISGKYIFANDFANYAFIKIKGKMETFELIGHSDSLASKYVYQSQGSTLIVEVTKKIPFEEESSKIIGKITLTNSNGAKTISEFFGTCGC